MATSRANCRALLEEIATLSDRITVIEQHSDDERKPSFSIGEPGKDAGIRFAGIPMGHEFTSLVLALLQVGGHPVKLDDAVIEQIRNLDGDYEFETYISLSCQNCPEVVQALNVMTHHQSAHPPGHDRRRALPERSRSAPDHGGADRLHERRSVRPGPHRREGNPREARQQRRRACREGTRKEAGVRRADRRRRTCRRGGCDLRGAQGHRDGRGRGTLRRTGARYARDRKLRLREGNRRTEVRDGARTAREEL